MRPKSKKRLSIDEIDLVQELGDMTIGELAIKLKTTKSMIQTVLTNQLNLYKKDPNSDGFEERLLRAVRGSGDWTKSVERTSIINYKKSSCAKLDQFSNLF
jgi:hypothetical protein